MQKIRYFSALTTIFVFSWSIFFPVLDSFSLQEVYDYTEFSDKINFSSGNTSFSTDITFSSLRTSFSLVFDGLVPEKADDVRVEWSVDGKTYSRFLDIEEKDDLSRITTFPFVTSPRESIYFRITTDRPIDPRVKISLLSSSQAPSGRKIVFSPGAFSVHASTTDGVQIISRSEWGADETIRYVSPEKQAQNKADWIARGQTPRIIAETSSEKAKRIQAENEYNAIASETPESSNLYSLKRYENGNKLIWPIEKTKRVNRIVIHHTAEALDQDADDATLIRAIYLYHARTKGWGDIGYNYIVGQRGKIYEGRAGGDYAQGAHVYGNNRGSAGISVLGNYENLTINKDQKAGLITAITYVAKKYGVRLDETSPGASLCASGSDCIWHKIYTPSLMGHRDLAATTCPGKNLYALLPELRNTVVGNVGNIQPIYNTETPTIEKIDLEDEITYTMTQNSDAPSISPISSVAKSSGGSPIKIRLSYPNETLTLVSLSKKLPLLRLDNKRIPITSGTEISISKNGSSGLSLQVGKQTYEGSRISFSSDVVRIPSWSRIPSWDNLKKYNDNSFRGKISVYNQNNTLLVINELPLEDYLKGLGEVSNSDHAEKLKTIIVAARSYAKYYSQKSNRKYGTLLYDGSDNPDEFQKYLGYGYEMRSPDVSRFVDMTHGEVIYYRGKLVKAWYFSSSDGKTRSYKEYCETNGGKECKDIPYLQSVDDPAGVGKVRSGHGVGISGIGATYAASIGKTYKDIISYYLHGVKIRKIH